MVFGMFGHSMRCASGPSIQACHFLLYRFDFRFGFKPDMGESWICQKVGTTTYALRGQLGWYTGLWRSAAGKVYVSYSIGQVLVNPDPTPRAAPWREDAVPGTLSGIWGLNDDCVFTWGTKGGVHVLYRYDGRTWNEMPAPGEVEAMHGIAPDLVYAVSRNGPLSRWDGRGWTTIETPARGVVTDVHAVNEDEIIAVTSQGEVLHRSSRGWAEPLQGPGYLSAVTMWKGEVWLAAESLGVLKVSGSTIVLVKPNLKATALDSRGDLLVSTPTAVAGSTDGTAYFGVDRAKAARTIAQVPAMWRSPGTPARNPV